MRKRTSQFINLPQTRFRHLIFGLLLLFSVTTSVNGTPSYDELPVKEVSKKSWLSGTAPGGVEFISLDWSILSEPDNLVPGDSVCFTFTATNLSSDTLNNVMISKGSTIASAVTLLPNGVMSDNTNPLTGSGTYVLTGSGCSVLTSTDIENGFVVCPAVAFGLTNGMPPEPVAACSDAVFCFDVTLSCSDLNISLDAECETLLTPELLSVPDSLQKIVRVRIQEPNGDFRPLPMVGDQDVGTAVKVVIDIPGCSNVPSCWSYANIEYKLGPSQICTVDTVSCFQQVAMNDPIITFTCGPTEFIRGEVVREDLCRTSEDFMAKETITYAVRDGFGNISDTCVQVRYIRKSKLEETDIVWPNQQTVLSCEGGIFDEDGETILPFFSGVPRWIDTTSTNPLRIDTLDLTDPSLPQACNVLTDFEDVIQLERNCESRIIRRWGVRQWLCEGGFKDFEFFQTIILRDTTPPEIEIQAGTISLTVNESTCSAMFTVPPPTVSDNCQPANTIEVEIRYPGGSTILNPDLKPISLPLGEHNLVEYIARDRCGNESRDTTYVNVVDNTNPVAICLRDMVVSITADEARVNVEQFDENSYDACGLDRKCVVRMDDLNLFNSLDIDEDGLVLFETFDVALMMRESQNQGCYRDFSSSIFLDTIVTDTITEEILNLDSLDFGDVGFDTLPYNVDIREVVSAHTICTPEVRFCCLDTGNDVPVILRIYDDAGNRNECMVMVSVQDKSDPIITCPTAEISVSCDFDFDPNANLDGTFGTILNGLNKVPLNIPSEFLVDSSGPLVNGTFIDNCFLSSAIETREVNIDSICRTGTILRKFSILRGSDTMQVCEQLIRIVGDQNNNPLEWATFPADVEVEIEANDDIRRLAIDHPPTVKNRGCSLIGLGHRDQYFTPSEGDYCTKIVRTWEVIDWCRNPTGLVELDSIQFIFVIDNEAPVITVNTPQTRPEPLPGDAIELVANASDNVVENPRWLDWRYEVFRGSQNTPIVSDIIQFEDFRNSTAVIRLEGLTRGSYEVHWIVADKCMNIDTAIVDLTIEERRSDEEALVVGQVSFSMGGNMDNVDVFLSEQEGVYADSEKTLTDDDGVYAFDNMPLGGEYFIDPEKNDDPLNGVSTLDLILIQRHILGLNVFEDPALEIAADVNADRRITALDLVELRRILLGQIDNFTSKDSWSFIYEGQDLEDIVTYGDDIKEAYHIAELVGDMDISFMGIKTGDVSGDAIGHSAQLSDSRSDSKVEWVYELNSIEGNTHVTIGGSNQESLEGFQMTFNWDSNVELQAVVPGKFDINAEHYNDDMKSDGILPMSFNSDHGVDVADDDVFFTLVFAGEKTSDDIQLHLTEDRLVSEAYSQSGVSGIDLKEQLSQDHLELILNQNSPNPWSETTTIEANIPVSGEVVFRVYDIHNRLVHKEIRGVERGYQKFNLSQEEVSASGLYFFEVEIAGYIARQKMIKVN